MRFQPTNIPGVVLIEPTVFGDKRGFFFESYHKKLFAKHGIKADFVQDNRSLSSKGVLRGLHYQSAPYAQAKLVSVLRGSAFDVVVDIRPRSKTYGRSFTHVLSGENKKMIYIPAGFAHGFLTLENATEFAYKVSDYYSPRHEKGIAWNDPSLKIKWPKIGSKYVLSAKDRNHPNLEVR
jgi:dTDP-4-dehydrorhamnose 3,5-epimerase